MSSSRTLAIAAGAACVLTAGVLLHAGQQAQSGQGQMPSPLPLSLGLRQSGSSVTPAFEGWFHERDGSTSVLVGYFNRNAKQEFDIPVGPNNRIEPGGPDMGQPTHFLPGRQWAVLAIRLPKDFGDKKLTWTLTANGFTNSITLHTKPDYIVEPYEDAASKNTPPVIRFAADGAGVTGPPTAIAATLTASVAQPLTITTWVSDEGPKLNVPPIPQPGGRGGTGPGQAPGPRVNPMPTLKWSMYRGPAPVKFDPMSPKADKEEGGKASTVATFAAAGDYILRLQATDSTGEGGGGFQCCWTNTHVKVTVRP